MSEKIHTAPAPVQLTPAEKRAAEHLVAGSSNAEGAQALSISTTTFTSHIAAIGQKFALTGHRSRPARAHAVLASRQVPPPPAPEHMPHFTERELRLLRALAERPETYDIATQAGVAAADVRPLIADLVAKAGAANDTHLVALGHAWGLLGTSPTGSGRSATNAKTRPASPALRVPAPSGTGFASSTA
ncbi:LuxR C-terminal-related transcriptional regulator [Streptomyces sp. NPDC057682]|uniref:LuxR C-terminal-related transcriptional regulator n=1 Tax=Streptomyces sp. NPDC057682 TaxID=3346210 RepID=UPI0036C94900